MANTNEQATYRITQRYRSADVPKGYIGTLEAIDEATKQPAAVCDLPGRAVFSTLSITDGDDRRWELRPNRKIMPSRWTLTDPEGRIAMEFDQAILPKLANPLYKIAMSCIDARSNRAYALIDPRSSLPDRLLGGGPNDWAIVEGDRVVARLVRLPKPDRTASGLRGLLSRFLPASDPGIVTLGPDHLFPAPAALAMQALFKELTDVS